MIKYFQNFFICLFLSVVLLQAKSAFLKWHSQIFPLNCRNSKAGSLKRNLQAQPAVPGAGKPPELRHKILLTGWTQVQHLCCFYVIWSQGKVASESWSRVFCVAVMATVFCSSAEEEERHCEGTVWLSHTHSVWPCSTHTLPVLSNADILQPPAGG